MMGSNEHLYGLEVWRLRTKELRQEADKATLAYRLRAMRQKNTSNREATTAAKWTLLVATLLVTALMLLGTSSPAHATTTFTVNQTTDVVDANLSDNLCDIDLGVSGEQCTLRAAIQQANYISGADTITLPAGTYTLTRAGANEDAAYTGDLDVTDELTIKGAGARSTSVVGGQAPYDDRIFDIRPDASATISGLTITGGKAGGALGVGGGVQNEGDLTLDRVVVKNNTAEYVGGINSWGSTLNLTDSTVSGNSATVDVGGVAQGYLGTATITNSTISGNQAARFSGGVIASGGSLMKILNSTIASNTSGRLGGGIETLQPPTLVIVKNTIVASNSIDNCDTAQYGGIISSQGNNISSDDSCPFTKSTDKQNTNPLLGPLQDNGGPTDTRALLPGSLAVDAADAKVCLERDQRGVARKDGDKNGTVVCDIGSFERNDLTPPKVSTTVPSAGKTGVKRTTDLTATFSERMDRTTLNKSSFKLFKVNRDGSTTQITSVSVSSSTDGLRATLNPDSQLAKNAKYKAVVTTGAKDRAGNRLDQDRKQPKNQPMEWFFTTGAS